MKVTLCPPSTDGPQFDKHQFLTRPGMVTADSHIAYSDKTRMHYVGPKYGNSGGKQGPTPEWANNEDLLPQVILTYLERRFKRGGDHRSFKPFKGTYEERLARVRDFGIESIVPLQFKLQRFQNWRALAVKAGDVKRADKLAQAIQQVDSEIVCARKGYHVIATAVVYLSYRLGYRSTEVAKTLKITPVHVRQILNRMNHTWELMTGERRKSR